MSEQRPADEAVTFGPFRLDAGNACLWRGSEKIPLMPKDLLVLRYLTEYRGRIVTKDELLQAAWSKVIVEEGVLKVGMRRLRRVLADSARSPRFIETVHGRGYRFIAPLKVPQPTPARTEPFETAGRGGPVALATHENAPVEGWVVGRGAELHMLRDLLSQALGGKRQVVFLTGDPGMGKTMLVEAFVSELSGGDNLALASGQCMEHHGSVEPYFPILSALGELCRGKWGQLAMQSLRRSAPTWLVQMPWLLSESERISYEHLAMEGSQGRMLRELLEAVDAFTREIPLILVLEDLHWSDTATMEAVAALARRLEASRLLLLGTCRPAEVAPHGHPLRHIKSELQLRGRCVELILSPLPATAVDTYLRGRFPTRHAWTDVAQRLHRRTEGHPLFLVTIVDDLVRREILRLVAGEWAAHGTIEQLERGVPTTLQEMIQGQLERVSGRERRILEAGSVADEEFSAATVAAAIGVSPQAVEVLGTTLAERRHILRVEGLRTYPDGTVSTRYSFRHEMYRQVMYARTPSATRRRLHLAIGTALETRYGDRTEELSVVLAAHFAQGGCFHAFWH